jgi:hypothetical protein
VQALPKTTNVVSSNLVHDEVYSIQLLFFAVVIIVVSVVLLVLCIVVMVAYCRIKVTILNI